MPLAVLLLVYNIQYIHGIVIVIVHTGVNTPEYFYGIRYGYYELIILLRSYNLYNYKIGFYITLPTPNMTMGPFECGLELVSSAFQVGFEGSV